MSESRRPDCCSAEPVAESSAFTLRSKWLGRGVTWSVPQNARSGLEESVGAYPGGAVSEGTAGSMNGSGRRAWSHGHRVKAVARIAAAPRAGTVERSKRRTALRVAKETSPRTNIHGNRKTLATSEEMASDSRRRTVVVGLAMAAAPLPVQSHRAAWPTRIRCPARAFMK